MAVDDSIQLLVQAIHQSPARLALVISGGGSLALYSLLRVAGASRTLLEAVIPYGHGAMEEYLGARPARFVSRETSIALAQVAFRRAQRFGGGETPVLGISSTSSIATIRDKLGAHHCFVSVRAADTLTNYAVEMEKGARDRAGEETLVSAVLLNAIAEGCGLTALLPLALNRREHLEREQISADEIGAVDEGI